MSLEKIYLGRGRGEAAFHSQAAVQIVAYCLVWGIVQWFSSGNLDGYNDMLENHAWSQSWSWGTHKHPPFFAWVVGWWFSVFPQTDLSYRFLSYANVAVALWGVVALGRRLGLGQMAGTAALLLMWSFPYSTLAAKFNANSQLLSLWPWTAAWLLASWQEQGIRGYFYSILLGLGAAASMLSKYYSGLFLLGFLLPTMLSSQGRDWLRSQKPYLALLIFFLALTPHLLWVIEHDFVTFKYASDQGAGDASWGYVLRFALAPVYYWLPAWLGCSVTCAVVLSRQNNRTSWGPLLMRLMWRSWRPLGWDDNLFWLAMAPWGFSLICGMAGLAELSSPWAIPIGYAYSLLWLRNLEQESSAALLQVAAVVRRAFAPVLVVVSLLGVGVALVNANNGRADYYRPSREVAQTIADHWERNHSKTKLGWASGHWAENAVLSFYALPQVRSLPGFPDEFPATVVPHLEWQSEGGVVICPLGMVTPGDPRPSGTTLCEKDAHAWLGRHGRPVLAQRIEVKRQGWAFPRSLPFAYMVFDVMPVTR